MSSIRDIDFSDMKAIIHWIDENATDEIAQIGVSGTEAVSIFESHGYMMDFIPPNRDKNDSDEYGRWIISQALVDLNESSSIRGLISKFTKRWIERFDSAYKGNS